jgi:acetyl esterase
VSAQSAENLAFDPVDGAEAVTPRAVGGDGVRLWRFGDDGGQGGLPTICFLGGAGPDGTFQFIQQANYFASRGAVTFLVDYLASRADATLLDNIDDARRAIAWIARNASDLGVDPARIAVAGGSWNGYVAAATAMLPGAGGPVRADPSAMLLFNPALELERHWPEWMFDAETGPLRGIDLDAMSLLAHVRSDLPPSLVLHGRNDASCPFPTAERFAAMMRDVGNDCTLVGYDEQPHGFFNHVSFMPGVGGDWQFVAATRRVDEFLAQLGWLDGPPILTAVPRVAAPTVDGRSRGTGRYLG